MVDETLGQGGSYLLDPKTGKRTLIEQTKPAPNPASLTEETDDGSTSKKEDSDSEDRSELRG